MKPTELLARARTYEQGTREVHPGITVPFEETGAVRYNAPPYAELVVEARQDGDLIAYRHKDGAAQEGASVVLPLLHGTGGPRCHAGSLLSVLNTLSARPTKKQSGFVFELQKDPNYRPLAVEAWDLPGHGAGPDLAKTPDLDSTAEWLARHVRPFREAGLQIVPLARSGSAGLVVRVNQKYPGLLAGMIFLSGLHPCAMEHSMKFLRHGESLPPDDPGHLEIRECAMTWINDIYAELEDGGHWTSEGDPFGDTPVLLLTGRRDEQTPLDVRARFYRYSHPERTTDEALKTVSSTDTDVVAKAKKRWFVQMARADHDVLENRDRQSAATARAAYAHIFDFLKTEVSSSRS